MQARPELNIEYDSRTKQAIVNKAVVCSQLKPKQTQTHVIPVVAA